MSDYKTRRQNMFTKRTSPLVASYDTSIPRGLILNAELFGDGTLEQIVHSFIRYSAQNGLPQEFDVVRTVDPK